MGERIAIGMDEIKRAGIVGSEMARLIGAASQIKLPHTQIGGGLPTEKLIHVNSPPRNICTANLYRFIKKKKSGRQRYNFSARAEYLKNVMTINKGR